MPQVSQSIALAAFTAAVLASGAASAASDPTGVWMNDTGRGAIEIKKCGDGLCGHVVWVKDESDTKGCGRQILGKVAKVSPGVWDNGWIYSPERKKRYDVELVPQSNGTLKVTGYAGTKLFSRTMIWKKAPADLVRCGGNGEQVAAATTKTQVKASTSEVKYAASSEPLPEAKSEKTETAPAAKEKAPEAAPEATDDTAPAAEEEVAADESGEEGGSDLAGKLGEFLKKGDDGNCKLDLPWVKVNFKCKD